MYMKCSPTHTYIFKFSRVTLYEAMQYIDFQIIKQVKKSKR